MDHGPNRYFLHSMPIDLSRLFCWSPPDIGSFHHWGWGRSIGWTPVLGRGRSIDWCWHWWAVIRRLWCSVRRLWCSVWGFWGFVGGNRCLIWRLWSSIRRRRCSIGRFWSSIRRLWSSIWCGRGSIPSVKLPAKNINQWGEPVQTTYHCYVANQLELKIDPLHPQLQLVLHRALPAIEAFPFVLLWIYWIFVNPILCQGAVKSIFNIAFVPQTLTGWTYWIPTSDSFGEHCKKTIYIKQQFIFFFN